MMKWVWSGFNGGRQPLRISIFGLYLQKENDRTNSQERGQRYTPYSTKLSLLCIDKSFSSMRVPVTILLQVSSDNWSWHPWERCHRPPRADSDGFESPPHLLPVRHQELPLLHSLSHLLQGLFALPAKNRLSLRPKNIWPSGPICHRVQRLGRHVVGLSTFVSSDTHQLHDAGVCSSGQNPSVRSSCCPYQTRLQ